MKSSPVQELIDDIVSGVYPDPNSIRERYVLTQSLLLLVFFAKRKRDKQGDRSIALMRAVIKKMMGQPEM